MTGRHEEAAPAQTGALDTVGTRSNRIRSRHGLTLIELLASIAIMTIVLGAVSSALVLATAAIPTRRDPNQRRMEAAEVVDQMAGDLRMAIHLVERSATAVTFTVADRDVDEAPETIRYAWSGTEGDPLEHTYNSGSAVPILGDVTTFDLTYLTQATARTPRVLLVVLDPANLTAQDAGRKALIRSWGYPVNLIDDNADSGTFNTATATADVAYVSEEVLSTNVGTKLKYTAIGVVNEEQALVDEFGIASGFSGFDETRIDITDNTHPITSVFAAGFLTICSSTEHLTATTNTVGGGVRVLAERPASASQTLVVIETGGALYGGGWAVGRRVKLPWGGNDFDINQLSADGRTLMQRALDWAGGSNVVGQVQIDLEAGSELAQRSQTQVQLLNQPQAP